MAKTPAVAKAAIVSPMDDKSWQAEDDLRTLISAEKIKSDKDRFAAAMKKRDEMKKAIMNIGKDA